MKIVVHFNPRKEYPSKRMASPFPLESLLVQQKVQLGSKPQEVEEKNCWSSPLYILNQNINKVLDVPTHYTNCIKKSYSEVDSAQLYPTIIQVSRYLAIRYLRPRKTFNTLYWTKICPKMSENIYLFYYIF